VFCSITIEFEHGIGFQKGVVVGNNFKGEIRATVSDQYQYRSGREVEFYQGVWQAGLQVEDTNGLGIRFECDDGRVEFGSSRSNVGAHRQNDGLVIGLGVSYYFIIGGGVMFSLIY